MNTVQHAMTHIPTTRTRGLHPRAILRPPFSVLHPYRAGFTLVELMVSVAMVVLLLVGIHQVFRMSSNTIGTGQALVAVNREVRSAQTVMQEDFRRSMKDSPLFVIHSGPVAARLDPTSFNFAPRVGGTTPQSSAPLFHFNTLAERDRDIDGDPATIDRDGDGSEETTYTIRDLAKVNDRLHRSDIFGFFARGLFTRQTADDGLFVSDTKAFDAWVWYGHVKLPDPSAAGYYDPGAVPVGVTESPNLFAANWVLGRRAILLKPPATIGEAAIDSVSMGSSPLVPLGFYSSIARGPNGSDATFDARTAAAGGTQPKQRLSLFQSRIDLAAMTIESFRGDLQALRLFSNNWFNPLIFRYECDPRVRKPINSGNLAKTTPYFVGNVSQFLVEFAGDFITQNNDIDSPDYGLVTNSVPDGVIDFVMLAPNVLDQTNPPAYPASPRVRKTRWYGLPRDSNGDGKVTGIIDRGAMANAMPDVVPVWDVIRSNGNLTSALLHQPRFEMWGPQGKAGPDGYGSLSAPNEFRYVCAWTDSAPAMLRVVMKLEDPAGRLADGHWVEFVLDSP